MNSKGRANYDLLINNICEVFNRQLLEARVSPVITALEYVREYLMKMIVRKRHHSVVVWNNGDLFQVNEGRQNQVVVNLANRSCTCRKWEVSGIPCKHAVACIFNMIDNRMQVGFPEDWVHQSMRLQTTVYSFKINPVPGREFWAKSQVPSRLIPPYILPQVGRPGKKRKKSAGEVTEMVKDVASQPPMASASQPPRASASQPARASASQPARASASASASAKQPQRATSQPASAPTITRQTKTKNVAASAKKTPTRQSQRQKSAKTMLMYFYFV
ncbi:mutator type transposase [Tanacetum coccineum]